ncbi:MAG: hypothetical protein ACUVSU_11740 [Aggregatilineaceae bacterium]
MPDDPNRFDDDLLPDWLTDSSQGETGGSATASAPWEMFAGRYPEPPGLDQPGPAPWEAYRTSAPALYDDRGAEAAPWESAPRALEQLDWFTAGQQESPAESTPLPPPAPSGAEDWLSGFGEAAGYSRTVPAEPTHDLSWLTSPEEPTESAPLPDWQALREEWLSQSSQDEEAQLPAGWLDEELPAAPLSEDLSGALAGPEPVAPEEEPQEIAPSPSQSQAPSPPRGVIRRLTPAPKQPADEVESELPAWLSQTPPAPPESTPTGLTYEEWERQQREQEAEAQKSPQERLLEEIPDWFQQLDEQPPAPPPPQTEGPEFVPGWFLGLEDKAQEAPDWFQRLDLSTGPLEPPAEPVPLAPAEPEVPDWFRAAPEAEGIDWSALVAGSPLETGQGAVPDWLDTGPTADDRILAAEDIPFPDFDLEQVPPLPVGPSEEEQEKVEDFVERFEPLEPGEFDRRAALVLDETPDWLRELPAEAPLTTPAAPTLGPQEETWGESGAGTVEEALDWLTAIAPEGQPVEEVPPPPQPTLEAEPGFDLLETAALDSAALDALLSAAEPVEPSPPPPEAETEAPVESLQDLEALFESAPVEGEVPDLQRLFDQGELDRVLGAVVPSEPPAEPSPPPKPAALPAVSSTQPEWIEELRPTELPVTIRAAGAEASVRQRQVTELPERLRALRERALRELETLQPATSEAGALAGIPDALPAAELVIPAAVSPRSAVALAVTPEQEQRVQRLQALLDIGGDTDEETLEEAARVAFGEAEALEVPALPARRPRRPRRFRFDRLVVTLAMLIALLVPFATDALQFAADPPRLRGKQAAVAAAVDALQSGQYVLFAFEYGPAAAGELDPLAQAVLRDVLARGAVPLTISTDPAGALHARAVVAAMARDPALLGARGLGEETLQADEDYVTLRYLSGEAVGVRSLRTVTWNPDGTLARHPVFATSLRGDDTNLPIGSVAQDIALLVVVGDQVTAIRTWAEQLTGVPVPKVALVTAAVEPLAVPYVQQDGYIGYLAGVRDTVRYDTERNANTRTPYRMPANLPLELPDPDQARWHSMALGAAVAAGFVALGTVINLARALKRRDRR